MMNNTDYGSLKYSLQESLNKNLCKKGWTLRTLSDHSGVPYETLKKLANAKIDNPSLHSVAKVASAFGCSLDSLFCDESELVHKLRALPERSRKFVEAITDFELSLSNHKTDSGQILLPIVVPTGSMTDGMIYDSLHTEYFNATPYLVQFGAQLMCALKITNNKFYPVYLEDDLLLIARNRQPCYGSVCVFLHDHQFFIRKYIPGVPPRLESLIDPNDSVFIEESEIWTLFGCVLTVVR